MTFDFELVVVVAVCRTLRRDVMVEVDADGYHRIGLKSDTTQVCTYLSFLVVHVLISYSVRYRGKTSEPEPLVRHF